VPAVPCTVSDESLLIAAASSSDSIDFAVPGSPTSNSPRSPASVTTQRSTRARSPTNFSLITIDGPPVPCRSASPREPMMNVTTAFGVSRQLGGRAPVSYAARNASSSAQISSGGGAGFGLLLAHRLTSS
jgi:hypothetical protein